MGRTEYPDVRVPYVRILEYSSIVEKFLVLTVYNVW